MLKGNLNKSLRQLEAVAEESKQLRRTEKDALPLRARVPHQAMSRSGGIETVPPLRPVVAPAAGAIGIEIPPRHLRLVADTE